MQASRLYVSTLFAALLWSQALAGQSTVRRIQAPDLKPSLAPAGLVDTLWWAGNHDERSAEPLLSLVTSLEVGPAGNMLALDVQACAIRVFDATGRYVKSVGGCGAGPGEFRLPTLLAVASGGELFVYDPGLARLSEFDRHLRFVRNLRLSPSVSQPSDLLVTSDALIVSGVTESNGLRDHTIHVFSREDGRHIRSFGHLVRSRTPAISRLIVAGTLALSRDGGIWYAQPAPYLIEKYSADGTLRVSITRKNDFLQPADDAISITLEGDRTITSTRPHATIFAVHETENGSLLVQIFLGEGEGDITDLYGPDLTLRESYIGMPPLNHPLGADRFLIFGYDSDDATRIGLVRTSWP